MKPAKNQIGAKKILHTNKDSSASKIKSYFKPAPKSFEVVNEVKVDHEEGPKQFYVEMLKKKLQAINGTEAENSNQMDAACALDVETVKDPGDCSNSECAEKRKEITEWQEKYKELKRVYVKLSVNYAELDLKHKDLLKTVTGKRDANNGGSTVDDKGAHDELFASGEIKYLECLPLDRKKDSTFVLQCLQFLYKKDPIILASKSLYGVKESIQIQENGAQVHRPAKQPLTPTKVDRIKQLFVERISKCDISSVEYGERIKDANINKLLASAIKNMSK